MIIMMIKIIFSNSNENNDSNQLNYNNNDDNDNNYGNDSDNQTTMIFHIIIS